MAYIIQNNCVACLKCVVECPVGAIRVTADRPEIDAAACIACGTCADVCKDGAPTDREAAPARIERHAPIEKECDVLVLGGGGAGLVAAARAAYKTGLRVIVLEKQEKTGGGAWYAADFKVYNSRWQKERGVPDTLEDSLRKAMDDTFWRLDPVLARRCFEATGEFFDWLCDTGENAEEEFREGTYIFDGPDGPVIPVFRKMRRGRQGGTGKYVMDRMLALCRAEGVEILTGCRATELLAENGRVTGALAEDDGGGYRIRCGACILATGSWIEDPEVLRRVDPKFASMEKVRSPHRSPAYTGDGLRLARQAGVLLDEESMCLRLMGPVFMPADSTPYPVFRAMNMDPAPIWVNEQGRRWISETVGMRRGFFDAAIPLREQTHGVSYTVFDANCIEAAIGRSRIGAQSRPFPMPPLPEDWRADMAAAVRDYGFALFEAGTPAELAEKIGVPVEAFTETIERYNTLCDHGVDTDFCKLPEQLTPLRKAPYYALRCSMATDGAFGGVPVDAELRAQRDGGGTTENLFAVGDIASGRFISPGGIKVQIINDLAWAFASGFLAGEHAAEYIRKKT